MLLESGRSRGEVKRALEFVDVVKRQEEVVIDMDSGSDSDGKMVCGLSSCKGVISMDGSSNYSVSNCEYNIQRIQLSDSGQPIANRRYHHYLQTNDHWLKRQIYFHFEGPFVIQNECFNVYIFQKWVSVNELQRCINSEVRN